LWDLTKAVTLTEDMLGSRPRLRIVCWDVDRQDKSE